MTLLMIVGLLILGCGAYVVFKSKNYPQGFSEFPIKPEPKKKMLLDAKNMEQTDKKNLSKEKKSS